MSPTPWSHDSCQTRRGGLLPSQQINSDAQLTPPPDLLTQVQHYSLTQEVRGWVGISGGGVGEGGESAGAGSTPPDPGTRPQELAPLPTSQSSRDAERVYFWDGARGFPGSDWRLF